MWNLPLSKWSFGFIPDTTKTVLINKNNEANQISNINIQKVEPIQLPLLNIKTDVIQVNFPDNQYYKIETAKKQIIFHHTVSGQGANGDLNWWLSTADRIGTHVVIDFQGKIYQCYSSKYWGHHIGCKPDFLKSKGFNDYNTRNTLLNQQSIAIEIDSWGGLIKETDGKWYPALWDIDNKKYIGNKKAGEVKNVVVYDKPFRGFYGYERYTDAQIESLRKLLVYWGNIYKIPLKYNPDMWDVSMNALSGVAGVYTHVSYRTDKSDCHPQDNLIEMLKSL